MFARNIGGDVSVTKVTMDGSLMICYGFDESFVVLVSWWCAPQKHADFGSFVMVLVVIFDGGARGDFWW